ncbi:dienelactone hydrolase family protein [Thiocystis violacea]|uniref:dienelactone hydrolase family protein n=1 Tax=Thiocystis violacea TaxID=13725 RepID=UPI001F5B9751|nr:alpha/beta hydrolase [Thiocystis violacea]
MAACLLVSGCFGGAEQRLQRPISAASPLTAPGAAAVAVRVQHGTASSPTGCTLHYRLYSTASARPGDLVVLGHGFLRSQARMAGLARALAVAGVSTVTLDFCTDPLWTGRHIRNGLDMMHLAAARGARRVVYVGFSAGGLAALVAGRNDPRAVGVVALDLVDAEDLGVRMAAGLKHPLIGLVGGGSACNAWNNGLAVYAAGREATVERFPGADHCDFESNTDWLCPLVCARGAPASWAVRRAILSAAVTAVTGLLSNRDG